MDSLRTANCGVSHQAFAYASATIVLCFVVTLTLIPTSGPGEVLLTCQLSLATHFDPLQRYKPVHILGHQSYDMSASTDTSLF
jgi:hypothetical protein